MTKYIALLRAVNVGGRVVKMDELKKMFVLPGIKNVTSFIQSGNILFESAETDKHKLIKKIETKLLKELGYEVRVILKTNTEIADVIKNNPFKKMPEGTDMYITFLSAPPDAVLMESVLNAIATGNEQVKVHGSEIYMQLNKGTYGETKLSNNFFEKKLKLYGTTRNWASTNKISALMNN